VELQISVRQSPSTNDHEVCLLGNGENLISRFDNSMMGLDPDDMFVDPCPLFPKDEPHMATIARCGCGVIGCGSVEVEIQRTEGFVTWKGVNSSTEIRFAATQYETEVSRAMSDLSWETPDRTAARLISKQVDRASLESRGYRYAWASGRCREGMMTVSLFTVPGQYQILVNEPWDGKGIESIVGRLVDILGQERDKWPNVEEFGTLRPTRILDP